tara:strand:+ start:1598 stop:2368 length:771 start_codon:yes stop_codon:yes gene_type:complete
MECLELFCGTKSFGKVVESLGHNVISVDLLKKFNPTHCVNILDFDYKQYDKNKFDIIWASPPCQYYSHLQCCRMNKIDKNGIKFTPEVLEEHMKNSDKIVAKTLEIINYFKPELWFMENPQTGKLKSRDIVKDLNYYDVDYCMYSDFGYKKRTRIWTNKLDWNNELCDGKGTCGNMIQIPTNNAIHRGTKQPIKSESRIIHFYPIGDSDKTKQIIRYLHKNNLGNIDQKKITKGKNLTLEQRYRVPPNLIYSLLLD